MQEKHTPVLLQEVIGFIKKETWIFVDATIGFGGHAEEILKRFENLRLVGIDQDKEALKYTGERLRGFKERVTIKEGNFRDIVNLLKEEGIYGVSGVLADLGVSKYQLDEAKRGFSFRREGPLDMRMDIGGDITAADIINEYKAEDLARIFYEYGEERFSRRIAKKIVEERKRRRIETTAVLREIVIRALPGSYKRGKIDPATRVFQALRIEVNNELDALKEFLGESLQVLSEGGMIEVISYHSLEDRIVKNFFKEKAKDEEIKIITKKPIVPSKEEVKRNPRARSAKLRVAERQLSSK